MMICYLKAKFLTYIFLKLKKLEKIIKLIIEILSPNNSNIIHPNPIRDI